MASSAANRPSDLEAQFQGETRIADGYQYWTTSREDEEAADIREIVDRGETPPTKAKPRQPMFKPGTLRRTVIRLASLLLIGIVMALAYFIFNLVMVFNAAEDTSAVEADAIVVLGAAQNNGEPSGVLRDRLDHAYQLWKNGSAPVIMTTGAGQQGEVNTEGRAGYDHLINKGVPEEALLVIPEGTNTYEQLSASQFQVEDKDFESLILVSDGYHNYRLLEIADELGMQNVSLSPSGIQPTIGNYFRESAAVSIGRITGYRRLSAFTES